MSGRLQGKIAIIVGAGQSAGETIGNGRAMAVLFARHGAQVLCVDRDLASAAETASMIASEGGSAAPFRADVSRDADCAAVIAEAKSRWGRIDILVNNVGIGGGGVERRRAELDPGHEIAVAVAVAAMLAVPVTLVRLVLPGVNCTR